MFHVSSFLRSPLPMDCEKCSFLLLEIASSKCLPFLPNFIENFKKYVYNNIDLFSQISLPILTGILS